MSLNDIVISGMSGRFPMSRNVQEFSTNLYAGTDMVTTSEDRWPEGILGFTNRLGRVPHFNSFDAEYFGQMGQMVEIMDPQSRMLLETTYEAIVDAGINPQELRGTKTGVYVGVSNYAMTEGYSDVIQSDLRKVTNKVMLSTLANLKALYANRITFFFDFRGPSLITDTACSASMTAFNLAMNDLRLGHIDYAIVGGTHMTSEPFVIQLQQEFSISSPRGVSAVLDESADGFVKADATACLLLQRRSDARRVYARILASRMNSDGKKTVGMFFPSHEAQESLMVMTYEDAGIDPLKLTYFEGHCTGTKVGDPQEVKAIYNAYCKRPARKGVLPLGMVKSNMGHTEGCSGISSFVKVILSFENESIAPNINLKEIKRECKEYCPPLFPNTEELKYEPGMAAINNFGIGGVNGNVIIEPNYKLANEDSLKICENIPRIVNICGRTEESVRHIFNFIENNPDKISADFLALLSNTMRCVPNVNSAGFPFRGSIIIKKSEQPSLKYEYRKQLKEVKMKTIRPIWFLFPGLGGQWPAMAKALMPIKIFADKIEECHQILSEFGINLKHMMLSEDKNAVSTMTGKFCATTCIEIALFETLKALDIIPDGIIGHSFGEIACAYADGCLTTEAAMIITYVRGLVTENDKKIIRGLMAVCALTKDEAKKLIPPEIVIACYNAKNTVVLSGPEEPMKELIENLKMKNIFVHQLDSSRIPYHSHYLRSSVEPMTQQIKKYLPNPKKRSKKWISTSILESEPNDELLNYASAEYFVNNLISPVYFYDRLIELPSDAIIVEIGPHGIFRKIIKESMEKVSYLCLIRKDSNETNQDNFLTAIATLYELGLNPAIENLYPKVEWPVSRSTPSIGSLIKWDHRVEWPFRHYPDDYNQATAADMNITVDLMNIEDNYYSGHCIDGNVLFPASGYLMWAWRKLASTLGKSWEDVPVVFENIQFRRPVFLSEESISSLKIRYDQQTGDFHVLENGNICAVGRVRSPSEEVLLVQNVIHEKQTVVLQNEFRLEKEDIYKELRVMGYDYSGEFKRLKNVRTNDFKDIYGTCEWNGKLVTFLDSLFQSMALAAPFRKLMVPVMIRTIRIDPRVLFEALNHNRVNETGTELTSVESIGDQMTRAVEENQTVQIAEVSASEEIELKKLATRFRLFRADMPFHFNSKSKLLLTHGIEVEDVMAFPIPRRTETSNLIVDTYEFIGNEDNHAVEEYDRKNILEYLEVCKSMAAKLKQIGLKDMKCDFNYQNLFPDSLERYRQLNDEHHVMFKVLDKLYKSSEMDENFNLTNLTQDQIKSFVNDLENNSKYNLGGDIVNSISKNERLIRTITDIVIENYVPKNEIKVTELNLTSDLLAKDVEQNMSNFQILPIDIDYKLIVNSDDNVTDHFKAKTKTWNVMEELALDSTDLLIFRDSFDLWQIDLQNLLKTIVDNINPNGFLMTVSKYRFTEPELALNSVLNDRKHMSNSSLEKRIVEIMNISKSLGLKLICNKSDTIGTNALLFRKVEHKKAFPEKDNIIEITSNSSELWFGLLKQKLIAAKEADNEADDVWLISRDTHINGIIGLINCLRLEPGGENIRCIFDYDCNTQLPIDWNSKFYSDILANDLVNNVIKDKKLGTYRHLKLAKDYDKVLSNEYFLNISQTRDLASLQWFDSRSIVANQEFYDVNGVRITQVPISIYSSGLTFHDVMVATGRIPSGPQLLLTDCLIGCEFAGRRKDSGVRVMGFEMTRCFATSINANVNMISPIPEHWSMDDAITVLSTYSTAWYGLVARARLEKGESILIHSGAGGVGQSAINICLHYDCDIYVTVGTEEKKRFLIKEYNIPEDRIFSSRDIQFKYRIKELTNGKGVDIVLNSLAGEKLDASYECLANGGRFVELGKFDLVQNKKLGMFDFLRDICFIGVAVDMCLMEKQDFAIKFFEWMHKNCSNGCVKPLNRIVFNANEAEKAFRYMTTGKHIGKIVIKIRDEEPIRAPLKTIKPAAELLCTGKYYFNANKVYIITGGLGGVGIELVHWMVYMGARKFVLTSRSGIKTDYQKYVINRLITFGEDFKYFNVKIEISRNDCLTVESTRNVLSDASQLGQIGGVFHLSLVLNDCLLEKLDFDKFCESIDTKYKVFNNLDVETRKLSYDLDFFVVFSSVACGKGNTGQSNYSFGNSLCERICEQRRSERLHGLAIQYGPIGDVGVFADSDQFLQMSNLQKQRINSCCDVLDKLLSVKQSVVTSYVKAERKSQTGSRDKRMVRELWKALGIDPETTPEHLTLGEIGMESMFAVELQQELERKYNIKVSINHVKTISVKMLKDYEAGDERCIQKYLADVKSARNTLNKYKFIIPKESYTQLNSGKSGKPVYFMAPFEITFSNYEVFATKFDRPVIGLNWTKDMSGLDTVNEITRHYTDLLKQLQPNGKYDIVGYFEGALVISKLLRKGLVNKAVIVDIVSDKRIKDENFSDEFIIEFVFGFLSNELPEPFKQKVYREIKRAPDIKTKLQKIVFEIRDFSGRGLIANDLEEIFEIALKRAQILSKYRLQKRTKFTNRLKEAIGKKWAKMAGKLSIIKPIKLDNPANPDQEVYDTRDLYCFPDDNESQNMSIDVVYTENPFSVSSESIGNRILKEFN